MIINNFYAENLIDKIDFDAIIDHPNILIAARFWEDERYNAAKICYKFMRYIDDMIDNRKSLEKPISNSEKNKLTKQVNSWINCLESFQTNNIFFKTVIDTITRFKIPLIYFQNFAKSMIFDINNNGFFNLQSYLDYSEGASLSPAAVFVHLCCLKKVNGDFYLPNIEVQNMARPCAIFSYIVHIIRDFQKDQNNNLNYFAVDILKKYDLLPQDLKKIAKESIIPNNFRKVINEYYVLAHDYKIKVEQALDELKNKIDPQYFLSLHIVYNLYLQIFERIDVKNGLFTSIELNPKSNEIKERVRQVIMHFKILSA